MLRKNFADLTLHWIRGNGDDKDTDPVDDSDDRAVCIRKPLARVLTLAFLHLFSICSIVKLQIL